jgi:molybdopterin-guanine dinucleotide biosynthesis protein A
LSGFTAVVLAGARPGTDPVAAYAGVSHKGLIELGGRTLLQRVVAALDGAGASRIAVAADDPALLAALPDLHTAAALERLETAAGPSQTVGHALEALGAPLLVTTVDHALLQPEWVRRFLDDAPADADVAVLLAPEAAVKAAAPQTQRTYLRFADGRYSGCNLFLLRTERAKAAVALWRTVERHRKRPWKIALLLGPGMLLRYALGRLTLDQAVEQLGRRAGLRAAAVRTPFGLAAVDVDKPADLDLVRTLILSPSSPETSTAR